METGAALLPVPQPRRNGELRRLVPPITQKMLTQQLRELETDGIVVRTVHEQIPPKVVYSIDPDERPKLAPLLDALCGWGLDWAERTGATIDAFESAIVNPRQPKRATV